MDCSAASERILTSSIDDEVREHLRACAACAELAAEDGRLARALGHREPEAGGEGFDTLLDTVKADDSSMHGKMRSMATPGRLALAAIALLAGAVVYLFAWRRPDWSTYPAATMTAVIVSSLVALGLGATFALPRVYRPTRSFALRVGALVFMLAIVLLPVVLVPASSTPSMSGHFWGGVASCLGIGTLAAIPAVLVVRLLQRSNELELWPTIFAATAAGVGADLALQVHCPSLNPMHILCAHSALAFVYVGCAWIVVQGLRHRSGD